MLRVSSEPETINYKTLVFMQGEEAAEPLSVFHGCGPDAAAGLMLDYANEDAEEESAPPFGTSDRCYWIRQEGESGLIVSVHPGGLYIALTAWKERAA